MGNDLTIGITLAVAGLALCLGMAVSATAPRLWLASTLGGTLAAMTAAMRVLATGTEWQWRSTMPIAGDLAHLRLDGISAFFLVLLCIIAATGALYSRDYWSDRAHPRSARMGRIWWNGLVLALALVLLASNGLHFLIGWELFTLCAYFLITLDRNQREARVAGWLYLAVSHAAVLALFAFFSLLAANTGSWDLGPMRNHPELTTLYWLLLFGCGIKAGVFPLHIWLPSAHANAPSHVSAMLSGVSLKIGIYALVRFASWLPMPDGVGWVVTILGLASAVLGVAFALGQHDLKRLLAYHSVENIGIILIGLGFALVAAEQGDAAWGRLALAGALLHVWNHGLFKSLLFLGAGSVLHATGTREMSRLGGLWRAMPWTTGLFVLGAVAICGLPPLNGFVSEWLLYLGLFDAAASRAPSSWAAIPAAVLLAVTGALALACFVKAAGVVFLGAPRSAAALRAHESGWAMRGAMLVLAGTCVAIGFAPIIFWPALATALNAWQPTWAVVEAPVPLVSLGLAQMVVAALAVGAVVWLGQRVRNAGVRRALTWDCGYVTPTARMQYTAASFADTITDWFAFVLRPERHERLPVDVLPTAALRDEHVPEAVLRHVVEPVSARVMQLARAARSLQHGGVQSYLLYIVFGVVALSGLAFMGGAP